MKVSGKKFAREWMGKVVCCAAVHRGVDTPPLELSQPVVGWVVGYYFSDGEALL